MGADEALCKEKKFKHLAKYKLGMIGGTTCPIPGAQIETQVVTVERRTKLTTKGQIEKARLQQAVPWPSYPR